MREFDSKYWLDMKTKINPIIQPRSTKQIYYDMVGRPELTFFDQSKKVEPKWMTALVHLNGSPRQVRLKRSPKRKSQVARQFSCILQVSPEKFTDKFSDH